ncbi:hypothetical protein DVH24_029090 [Malus domestica]|uniref:Late embryogenesis abundant protein LEA-2 subgroup domain-containing protein n=1 Tax=Malus domestica TaxID=3750 RepID=A0A498HUP5_MALDO|nr:hypothetical protein DVH24_029090 [Malus domestica]
MAVESNQTSDQEMANSQPEQQELKRKKRIRLAIYIAVFLVFQIIVITVLSLTVLKVKSPKVRLGALNVQNLTAAPAMPSFDVTFATQIRIKNTNFGRYKFDASTIKFDYDGATVGQVSIPKGKAGMWSTKKIDVTVNLSTKGLPSSKNSSLRTELSTGVLRLMSEARVKGKVELMMVMKKNKSAKMDCTLEVNLSTKKIQYLKCE